MHNKDFVHMNVSSELEEREVFNSLASLILSGQKDVLNYLLKNIQCSYKTTGTFPLKKSC